MVVIVFILFVILKNGRNKVWGREDLNSGRTHVGKKSPRVNPFLQALSACTKLDYDPSGIIKLMVYYKTYLESFLYELYFSISMFQRFSHSFQLVKESFAVLKKDKEIMLFPILSGILSVLALISLFIPFTIISLANDFSPSLFYTLLFVYYVITSFIVIFFNTGLITCAHMRLNGKDPTFNDGLKHAWKHVGNIFIWSLISATVGLILRMIVDRIENSERLGPIGKIVGMIFIGLLGMAWSFLTFFVIPVMVFENRNAFESIKHSGSLFKKTWGENVIGQFSMGLIFGLLFLVGAGAILVAFLTGSFPVILIVGGLTLLYFTLLVIVSTSLNGIFVAAMYNYAKTGKVPAAYSPELVKGAFRAKRGGI